MVIQPSQRLAFCAKSSAKHLQLSYDIFSASRRTVGVILLMLDLTSSSDLSLHFTLAVLQPKNRGRGIGRVVFPSSGFEYSSNYTNIHVRGSTAYCTLIQSVSDICIRQHLPFLRTPKFRKFILPLLNCRCLRHQKSAMSSSVAPNKHNFCACVAYSGLYFVGRPIGRFSSRSYRTSQKKKAA